MNKMLYTIFCVQARKRLTLRVFEENVCWKTCSNYFKCTLTLRYCSFRADEVSKSLFDRERFEKSIYISFISASCLSDIVAYRTLYLKHKESSYYVLIQYAISRTCQAMRLWKIDIIIIRPFLFVDLSRWPAQLLTQALTPFGKSAWQL